MKRYRLGVANFDGENSPAYVACMSFSHSIWIVQYQEPLLQLCAWLVTYIVLHYYISLQLYNKCYSPYCPLLQKSINIDYSRVVSASYSQPQFVLLVYCTHTV